MIVLICPVTGSLPPECIHGTCYGTIIIHEIIVHQITLVSITTPNPAITFDAIDKELPRT
jgi:hypothetical protein